MVPDSAEEITEAVSKTLKASAAAGKTPAGVSWPAPVEGGKPLKNAAADIRIISKESGLGLLILAKLTSKRYVLHHIGEANGAPRRQILPDDEDPRVHAAIKVVLDKAFDDGS